jgi:hypothetical protein
VWSRLAEVITDGNSNHAMTYRSFIDFRS